MFGIECAPGVKDIESEGFYGKSEQIITYDPEKIRPMLTPFMDPKITVINSVNKWLYHLGFLGYAIILMTFTGLNNYPDGELGGGVSCPSSDPTINFKMCQLNTVITDAKNDFRALIAFVLAGFVVISITTWESRRQNYAALCGQTRNLIIQINAMVPIGAEYFGSSFVA